METLSTEPELYALLHRGTPGDQAFYLQACRGADTVLEFGCGGARLMTPLALAGHRVSGIDSDAGLLQLARATLAAQPAARERSTLHHGDMRSASLAGRFDRVLIPYNALYCLASEAEQVACLENAARHLAPGGLVVFDAYAIDTFHYEADEDEEDGDGDPVATLTWRNTVWEVYEHCAWHRAEQRLHVHYRCQPRDGSGVVHQRIDHRYLLTGQLRRVCEAAGLRIVEASGGFHREPLSSDSEHLVCLAGR